MSSQDGSITAKGGNCEIENENFFLEKNQFIKLSIITKGVSLWEQTKTTQTTKIIKLFVKKHSNQSYGT